MNFVLISGNIAKDVKYSETENGDQRVIFDLAVKDGYLDKDKEWVDKPIFVKVKAYKKPAESMKKAKFQKGNGIVVTGRLDIRKWEDEEGNKKSEYYIKMNSWEFPTPPGRKKNNEDNEEADETKPPKDEEVDLEDINVNEDAKPPKKKSGKKDEEDFEDNEGFGLGEENKPAKPNTKKAVEDDGISPEDLEALESIADD